MQWQRVKEDLFAIKYYIKPKKDELNTKHGVNLTKWTVEIIS